MEEDFKRYSRQREEVLRILKGTNLHPTAEWVYFQTKKKIPRISLGTVYRNLNQLQLKGKIKKYNFGTPFEHFDGNTSTHQHFICKKCGKIYDLFIDLGKNLKVKVEKKEKFKVEEIEVEFHGRCLNCLKFNQ